MRLDAANAPVREAAMRPTNGAQRCARDRRDRRRAVAARKQLPDGVHQRQARRARRDGEDDRTSACARRASRRDARDVRALRSG